MAKDLLKGVNIRANFQLDTSAARQSLIGLQRELSNLANNSIRNLGVTEQITEATRAAQLLKQTLAEATDISTGKFDLSKFTASMNQNMMTLEKFKSSLETLGPEGQKAFNSLASTITSAQIPIQRTNKLASDLLNTFGNTLRWQATSMAIHKVVGTMSEAYNYAQNLDKSLNKIQIVTGHSADYMKNFAVQANKAAQALSASTLEYTNASLIYYQQGLSDKEVTKRAETTLKLAKVTGESASKVSQQMTAVWNNFSNGLDNLERYADVMTALGATTASSSSEIAKGLEKFASISKTIGLSYDYAASALATVTAQTRQSADSVGTAFKTLFSRLESLNLGETLDDGVTLNKYSEALMKVGVNVLDVNGQLKNMDTILDELGGRWDKLNAAQQVALAQTVGGVRNYTSLITLMDNWEKFQQNVTTAHMAEGTLQQQADIYAKSWEAAQQRVKTASQNIYDTLLNSDFFKAVNNVTAGLLNGLGSLGRGLGTTGSLAGIGNLVNLLYGDRLSSFIEDKAVNLLGNTSYGIRQQAKQQETIIASYRRDLIDSGLPEDAARSELLQAQQDTWKSFSEAQKNRLFTSPISEQAYYNQLINANQMATESANKIIDATTATSNNFIIQAQAEGRTLSLLGQIENNSFDNAALWKDTILPGIKSQGQIVGDFQAFSETFNKDIQTFLSSGIGSKSELAALERIQGNIKNYTDSSGTFLLNNEFGKKFFEQFTTGGIIDKTALREDYRKYIADVQKQDIAGSVIADLRSGGAIISDTQERQLRDSINAAVQGRVEEAYRQTSSTYSAQTTKTHLENLRNQLPKEEDKTPITSRGWQAGEDYARQGKNSIKNVGTTTLGQTAISTAQTLNAFTMAGSSIKNFAIAMDQGNATIGQFVTTTGSSLYALGAFNKAMNNSAALTGLFANNLGKGLANRFASSGVLQGLGLSEKLIVRQDIGKGKVGQIQGLSGAGGTLATLGVMGAIAALVAGIKVFQANTIDSKIGRANELKISAAAQAKEDKTKYDQFLSIAQAQNDSINKLYGLQRGTAAYTSQLINNNNSARELINTYGLKEQEDYSYDKNGAIVFSAQQISDINDRLLNKSLQSENLAQIATSQFNQLNYSRELSILDTTRKEAALAYGEDSELYKEKIKELDEKEQSLRLQQQADFETVLSSAGSLSENQTDARQLAIDYLGSNLEEAKRYTQDVTDQSKWTSRYNVKAFNVFGRREAILRQWYKELYGEDAGKELTKTQLENAITTKAGQNSLLDSITDIASKIQNVSDYSVYGGYTQLSATALNDLITRTSQGPDADTYATLNQLALSKQAESIDNLATALQSNTNFQEMNYLQTANEILEQKQLSIDQMNTLSNYINNFGVNFGDNTGKYIYEALTSAQAGLNTDLVTFLEKNNFNNSISGLASLERAIGLDSNSGLNATLTSLRDSIMLDVRDRGGLAQMLFSSSDFQNVFESLEDVFQTTGEITAQNVMDLSKKNEIIGDYLQLNGGNAAAIADMASMIASGRLSISDLTPAIENFVNDASSSAGAMQNALQYLNEQDYSDSLSTLDKWAQTIGKAFYTGKSNDMLFDAPVKEALKDLLSPDDWQKFNDIIYQNAYGGSTANILSQMQSEMPEAYKLLTTLGGTGKRSGKGGGGMDDVYKYIADQAGFEERGILVDNEGRFSFDQTQQGENGPTKFEAEWDKYWASQGQENVEVTFDTLNKYIESIFTGENWSSAQAEKWSTMMMGKMSASSMGSIFEAAGVVQGTKDLFKQQAEENGQEVVPTSGLTLDQIKTVFDTYAEGFAHVVFDEDENGNRIIREATQKEVEQGTAGISRQDYINFVAAEARANGTALVGLRENYGRTGDTNAAAIGNALQQNSYGTISGSGVNAIIEAAIKSGVDLYSDFTREQYAGTGKQEVGKSLDFEELQKFYTETLGLSQQVFENNLKDIVESGTALSYRYTDIFGDTHTISSRGKTTEEFQQEVQSSKEDDQIREAMQQKWLNDALSGTAMIKLEDGKTERAVDTNNVNDIKLYIKQQEEAAKQASKQADSYESEKNKQEEANKYAEDKAEKARQEAVEEREKVSQFVRDQQAKEAGSSPEQVSKYIQDQRAREQAVEERERVSQFVQDKRTREQAVEERENVSQFVQGKRAEEQNQAETAAWSRGTTEDRNAIINAAADKARSFMEQNGQIRPDQLTPFEKQLLTAVGEINETTDGMYQLSEDQAEGETAADRAGKRGTSVDEEGNIVDENGNIIMPSAQAEVRGTNGQGGQGTTPGSSNQGGVRQQDLDRLFNAVINGNQGVINLLNAGFSDAQAIQYLDKIEEAAAANSKAQSDPANNPGNVFCFAKGTPVLMANGTSENIENIKIDQFIIAYDEETHQFVPKKVIGFQEHHDTPSMVQLSFHNGDSLILTPGHPLYSTDGWKSLDIEGSLQAHNVVATMLHIGDIVLGINKIAIVTDILYLPQEGNTDSYNIDIEDCHTYLVNGFIAHNKATGQNNHTLYFASGKEGHIAVTGELGPELRIKSDGSADLLGKQGREYTWVDPDDIIYTATQTAGILGNNSIPALEGLSKGIRNYIPGYMDAGAFAATSTDEGGSSSHGGGGHGGGGGDDKDPRYDPNTLKIRDILERYYTILQQIDDISKAVEHISKAIDRGWGQERIKNLDRQEKLLEKQYQMQEKYVSEIKEYTKSDQDALTTMISEFVTSYNEGKDDKDKISWEGAQFDENGVLINYREFVEKLTSKYNENAEENAKDKEAQYKFQEQLKDIQFYTESLNTLQEAEEALYDLNNQILDVKIQKITYAIEYQNEMDANDLRLINFQYDQIANNAYRSAEAIDLVVQKNNYLLDELHRYEGGFFDIIGQYVDTDLAEEMQQLFYDNPTKFAEEWQKLMETDIRFQDITDPHKNQLESYMERMTAIVKTLEDNYDETINKMSDDLKTFGKALDNLVDKFDYFDSIYKSLNDIIGLTNRELTNIDAAFMKNLNAKTLDNNMNKLQSARRELASMQQALNEATLVYQRTLTDLENYTGDDEEYRKKLQDKVDLAKKALDTVVEYNENATKQFYQAWENCLKSIQESYKSIITEAGRDFERSISPFFVSLEILQNQYDKGKEIRDLYVKDYQRFHDLSRLNRELQNSILDTDNIKSKERLRELQKEINDLQDSGVELSEYDLDILDKKYKLELARQALEDARDAKSLVRLSRDNNGNWGYVYTSNEDEVSEAEQSYEDAILEMEQANENYIDNLQEQIIAVTQQAKAALENLDPSDFASQEAFENYVNNLIQYYQDKLNFMTSQLNNAANNNVALAPDIQKMYDNLDHNLTNNFGDTLLSSLLGDNNLNRVSDNIMNGITEMVNKAIEGYTTIYSEMQAKVYEIAGADIANAATGFRDLINIIAQESTENIDTINTEATRMDETYKDTIDSILVYQDALDGLIQETKLMQNTLASMNTFLRSSGEYVPENTLYESFQTAYKDVTLNSGGYTGRWQSALSGMYTGEWDGGSTDRNGRLAFLHQKELVLNAHDTENFLDAMEIVRQLDNLTNWMANGLGDLFIPNIKSENGELEQNVHIEASFPNVTNHSEIEMAFDNLVNRASQYANRK